MSSYAGRVADYWLISYRRTWRGSVVNSFLSPILYVLALGVLLGGFIAGDPARLEGASSYLAFVAPGLAATQAMSVAFGEATYPVLGALKWDRSYYAMAASPLRVGDIVQAHLGFLTARVALVVGVFLAALAPFGVFASWWGTLLAFPVLVLLGLAFSAAIYAFSVGLRSEAAFSVLMRLGQIPLFLFSGAFFPVANLGPVMEWLARVTPLWQGVHLTRMLTLGRVDAGWAAYHLAYLVAMTALGYVFAVRRLTRAMVT